MRLIYKLFGSASSVALAYSLYNFNERKGLKASWTTHHKTPEPLQKWDNDWDKRHHDPEVTSSGSGDSADGLAKKPTSTRNIILIRHGQYNMEADTDAQRGLTALGREQAEATARRLKALNIPVTRLVWSTMTRATETGQIVSSSFKEVPTESCALLREGAPIPPEPPSGSWAPEAKQFYDDGARIEAAFRKYFHRADVNQMETSYDVIVCHANVIRYFVCRALQLPPEAWLRMSLNHGSITWLVIRPNGRVSLRALGDTGFLPVDMISS